MLDRFWMWATSWFRPCTDAGRMHTWEAFQVAYRRRCVGCGMIWDRRTGQTWASWDDYVRDR
jgi:hypothetical protein